MNSLSDLMTDELFEKLLHSPENWTVDYKVRSYDFTGNKDKVEGGFIKDVMAFSNTIRKETSYIIAGIDEEKGVKNQVGITNMIDDATLQQMARSKIFPAPRFLSYIHIYNNKKYGIIEFPVYAHLEPLVSHAKLHGIDMGKVYLRRGSANDEAQYHEVKALEKWLKALKDADIPLPEAPVNEKYPGYIPRTVTAAEADSIAQFMMEHDTLEQALDKEQKIALLGWGLSGKTTELKELASKLSKRADARVYRINLGNHLKGAISKRIPEIDRLLEPEKVYVLLDGLDEILPKHFDEARRKIAQFVEKYPLIKVVVSCRTNFYTTDVEDRSDSTLTDFSSYWLDNLDRDVADRYLSDHLRNDKANFLHEIDKKDIRDLLVTPYYLTKLVTQFKETRRIAGSKADIFKLEIRERIKKDIQHYKRKERDTLSDEIFELLSKVAFVMETHGTRQITTTELVKILPDNNDFKKIRKIASLFQGTDGSNRIWKFNHNNTQEYLAANSLSKLSFKAIKKIVGIGPDFNKVKPSWVNTISFLNSILRDDSALKAEITEWLIEFNRDLVIAMEPEKIDDATKLEIFKSVFLKYKAEGRRTNRNVYRVEDLAKFSESTKVFDFLLKELSDGKSIVGIGNALEIINFYPLYKYKSYQDKFKVYYEQYLFGKKSALYLSALAGYPSLFPLTKHEFLKVHAKFKDDEDTWIRYQLFTGIWLSKTQNELVQYLIDQALFLVNEDRPLKNNRNRKTRLSNEYSEIANALNKVDSAAALTTLFKGEKHFHALVYSTYFKKVYPTALKSATKFPDDLQLFKAINQVFLENHSYILHDKWLNEAFLQYYRTTGHLEQVLPLLYRKNGLKDFSSGHSLATLATTNFIDLLKAEAKAGHINQQQIENLRSMMDSAANPNEAYFRKQFKLPAPKKRPQRDHEKERLAEEKRNLRILFDEGLFHREVQKIFDAYGKTVLTNEDRYSSSGVDFYGSGFAEVARDVLELGPHQPDAILDDVQADIANNFERRTIGRLYEYLLKHAQAVLSTAQREIITKWCDGLVPLVDFKQGIVEHSSNNWDLKPQPLLLSFFIRYLNLTDFDDSVYLDMLSFIRFQDSLIDIIPFVESVVGFEKTKDRILSNMQAGVSNKKLLSDYVKFLGDKNVTDAADILLEYLLKGPNEEQYELLSTFIKFGGDAEALYPVLTLSTSYFRHRLIEVLIQANNPKIKAYLKTLLEAEEDPAERLNIIRFLVRLQDKYAVALYLKHIADIKRSPDDSSPGNPLYSLRKFRFTKEILELYELSQGPSYYADNFADLRHIASSALQNIALHPGNFLKFTRLVNKWIVKRTVAGKSQHPVPVNLFKDLQFFLETFGKQYETSNVEMPSLEEGIKIYRKVLKKRRKDG